MTSIGSTYAITLKITFRRAMPSDAQFLIVYIISADPYVMNLNVLAPSLPVYAATHVALIAILGNMSIHASILPFML